MTVLRDYADKSYLNGKPQQESTFQKVCATLGLAFCLLIVFGILCFPESVLVFHQ